MSKVYRYRVVYTWCGATFRSRAMGKWKATCEMRRLQAMGRLAQLEPAGN
jgi:hypothetical protein